MSIGNAVQFDKTRDRFQVYFHRFRDFVFLQGRSVARFIVGDAVLPATIDDAQPLECEINADATINTAANPVKIGGYISLYATGAGISNLPVSVTIGGIQAAVQYAGSAPGQPAGLMQVNVQIPNGVRPGGYVPVTLNVGDASSTDGAVWIAVTGN